MNAEELRQKGTITILVLAFSTAISITIGGLVLFGLVQYQSTRRNESFQKALAISESGINYYRWHLAHDEKDYTDGTGEEGPYVHQIPDPQGGIAGEFSLSITPPSALSPFIIISSTGSTIDHPDIKRTTTVQFGKKSLASYAFLHNANVWFGQGITVYGEVFSNGGIRMDGINTSTVKSAKETYTCGIETGCWPFPETKPGVWGGGGPSNLWEFPAPPIDFDSISIDLADMRTTAQSEGIYLDDSGARGYHLVFNSDGTVSIYKVTSTRYRKGYSPDEGCKKLYQIIRNEQLIATYNLSDNPILFAEDTLWVEGVVNGKITVVAAQFPFDTGNEDIWIKDNITYLVKDGNHNLGLIAQNNIIYALDIPNTFEINAVLLAQKGRILRHHYRKWWFPYCSYYSKAVRDELIIYGSVISSQKSYWNYGSAPSSGFKIRTTTYDANLLYKPPPYFPTTGDFDIVSWNEDNNP